MRYTSPEDARSDLFLSAGVFLFGPLILRLVLDIIPLQRIPGGAAVLSVALPIVCTVLVPYLLIRYRKESLRDYVEDGGTAGFSLGLLLTTPIVGAVVLALVIRPGPLAALGVPALALSSDVAGTVAQVVSWVGSVALAWYATVKARDAFRIVPKTFREGTLEIGRILAIIAAVATLLVSLRLMLNAGRFDPIVVLLPLGVAGAVWLALRRLAGPSTTSRSVLLTPTLLLALSGFTLALNALDIVLHEAAIYAGIGLLIGMIQESRRSFYAVLALSLALALFTPIPDPLPLG
ncbi:MAG: hypothetical protein ACRDZO_00155 [Egibacteraceae bacterium]